MRTIRRLTACGVAALAIACAFAASASASVVTLKGTVVHRNSHALSFVVATAKGKLVAIHSTRSPSAGRLVRVKAHLLRNGTYGATRVKVLGRRHRVRMLGTVTYATRGAFTLSARGASILVHRAARGARAADDGNEGPILPAPAPAGTVTPPPAGVPPVGAMVEVDADVNDQGDVDAVSVLQQTMATGPIALEGTILAVDPVGRTLSVSADDDEQSGAAVTVSVPAGIDMTGLAVGQEVELIVTRAADGTFVLSQFGDDGDQQEADGGDHGGDGGGDGGGD